MIIALCTVCGIAALLGAILLLKGRWISSLLVIGVTVGAFLFCLAQLGKRQRNAAYPSAFATGKAESTFDTSEETKSFSEKLEPTDESAPKTEEPKDESEAHEEEELAVRQAKEEVAKLTAEKPEAAPLPTVAPVPGMRLVQPLPEGELTSQFGDYRPGPPVHRHDGIDIACTTGMPIRAVAAGQVYYADDLSKKGNKAGISVFLKHDGSYRGVKESHYFHLSEYLVRAGETVTAGQVIGKCGRSGVKRSGTHLHFEIGIDGPDGKAVDVNPCQHLDCSYLVRTSRYFHQES